MQRIRTTIPELNQMTPQQIGRRFEDVIKTATPEERSQFRIKLLEFTRGEPADDEEPINNRDLGDDDVEIRADLLRYNEKGYNIDPFLVYYAALPPDPNAMEMEGGRRRRKTRKSKRRHRKTRRSRK